MEVVPFFPNNRAFRRATFLSAGPLLWWAIKNADSVFFSKVTSSLGDGCSTVTHQVGSSTQQLLSNFLWVQQLREVTYQSSVTTEVPWDSVWPNANPIPNSQTKLLLVNATTHPLLHPDTWTHLSLEMLTSLQPTIHAAQWLITWIPWVANLARLLHAAWTTCANNATYIVLAYLAVMLASLLRRCGQRLWNIVWGAPRQPKTELEALLQINTSIRDLDPSATNTRSRNRRQRQSPEPQRHLRPLSVILATLLTIVGIRWVHPVTTWLGLQYSLDPQYVSLCLSGFASLLGLGLLLRSPAKSRPPSPPRPNWTLRLTDFSSRDNIIRQLVPQIWNFPFHAQHLVDEISREGRQQGWSAQPAFARQAHKISQLGSVTQFLSWFLSWNIPRHIVHANYQLALSQVQALHEPVTTYDEFLDTIRILEKLPYLARNFPKAFSWLTTLGAWSQPMALRRQLNLLYTTHPNYWAFMTALRSSPDIWCASLPRPSTTRTPMRSHQQHGRRNSARRTPTPVQLGAAELSDQPPTRGPRYFTAVILDPDNTQSTAYWDQGAESSFISPTLLARLQVIPTDSQSFFRYQPLGSGSRIFAKKTATVTFSIPSIPQKFSFAFIVHETKIAPLLLGCDFWTKYAILCQPGRQFKFGRYPIPLQDSAIEPASFDTSDLEDHTITDSRMQTVLHDLQLKFPTPAPSLPPIRPDDYRIKIRPHAQRGHNRPLPKYSHQAREFLSTTVATYLNTGLIEPSTAEFYAVPGIVPKHTGGFRIVFDYRSLNAITDPLPVYFEPFRSLITGLDDAQYFSTLDLASGYHQLRIHPDTRPYTAFNTPDGKFQWKVLPFGLCDAPAVFGQYLTSLLIPHSAYCRVYLDDILIFSPDSPTHLHHVQAVLSTLFENHHTLNWNKCTFHRTQVQWVGHQISGDGISADDTTKGQIQQIAVPQNKTNIKEFLGHVGYLQDLIPNFAHRSQPLTDLLVKNVHFNWSTRCQAAFCDLKQAVLDIVPNISFDPHAPIQVHTDASHFAAAAVLLQPDPKDPSRWRPVEYRSKKFNEHQRNWDIHLKEFWAVQFACVKFRYFLEGHFFTLYCDQQSIAQIINNSHASSDPPDARIQRWLTKISPYRFNIEYRPGELNVLADHLSRNPCYDPLANNASLASAQISMDVDDSWYQALRDAYVSDPTFQEIYNRLASAPPSATIAVDQPYTVNPDTKLLYYHGKLCIPQARLADLLHETHSSTTAGHPGVRRWLLDLQKQYYFKNMKHVLTKYVQSCDRCNRVKYSAHRPNGLLQPPTRPRGRWTDISTDLITGFPEVNYNGQTVDAILTIVDKFTNRSHFHLVSKRLSSQDFINILVRSHFPLHGIPDSIQSDRGPQFTSELYQSFMKMLGVQERTSVANHQQSNGRAENRNKAIEQYLRLYISDNKDWPELVPLGEFTINAQPSSSLDGKSPFEIDLGYNPKAPSCLLFPKEEPVRYLQGTQLIEELDRRAIAAKTASEVAFQKSKHYFDKRHRGVEFNEGDEVFISCSNLLHSAGAHNSQLAPKLQTHYEGPFKIATKLSPVNYVLEMPTTYKGEPKFHISQLRLKTAVPDSYITALHEENVLKRYRDGSTLVEIVKILDHRRVAKGYVLIAQQRPTAEYPQGEISEYRASALARTAPDLVRQYANQHKLDAVLKSLQNSISSKGG